MHAFLETADKIRITRIQCRRLTCALLGAAYLYSLRAGRLHAERRRAAIALGSHRTVAVAGVLPAAAVAAICAVGLAILTAAAACTSDSTSHVAAHNEWQSVRHEDNASLQQNIASCDAQ